MPSGVRIRRGQVSEPVIEAGPARRGASRKGARAGFAAALKASVAPAWLAAWQRPPTGVPATRAPSAWPPSRGRTLRWVHPHGDAPYASASPH